uniref:Uncharacterized protein n=3 Tax=Avena sativa TaxID=4498 RepID=A0ACD5VPM6_AVESA
MPIFPFHSRRSRSSRQPPPPFPFRPITLDPPSPVATGSPNPPTPSARATARSRPSRTPSMGGVAALLLLALACALCGGAAGYPRTSVAGQSCAPGEAVSGSVLADNFVPSMDDLNTNVSANDGFGTSAVGTAGPNTVFGLGQCLRDLSALDCKLCFSEVRSLLPKCYPRVGGRLFLDGCFGRYANYSFFAEALGPADAAVCGSGTNYTANPRGFGDAVRAAVANVSDAAAGPGGDGFAVGSADAGGATAFALAQCWESLNATACSQCLRAAAGAAAGCAPATEGRALYTGCYLRYSTRLFWNVNDTAGSSGKHAIVWILLGSFLAAFVVLIIALLAWKKGILRRTKQSKSFIDMYGDGISARIAQSSLNFKYEELRKATNYFDPANKLGQGSNGAVYKAVLPDGKEVAVKRLFLNTREWVDQFFNEVELISQVRHKSLVKLLGCSVNGPESLLVYEYYFNKSLELFLFGKPLASLHMFYVDL